MRICYWVFTSIFIAAWLTGCGGSGGGNGGSGGGNSGDETMSSLTLNQATNGTITTGEQQKYSIDVTPGQTYYVALYALSDDVDLYLFKTSAFDVPITCPYTRFAGTPAEGCLTTPVGNKIYLGLSGSDIAVSPAEFTVMATSAPTIPLSPFSPTAQIVEKHRAHTYASTVTKGELYAVTLTGLTDDVDLLVFGEDSTFEKPAFPMVNDTFKESLFSEEAILPATGSNLYSSVSGSFVSGSSGGYTIEVKPWSLTPLTDSTPISSTLVGKGFDFYELATVPGTRYYVTLTVVTSPVHFSLSDAYEPTVNTATDLSSVSPKTLWLEPTGDKLYAKVQGEVGSGYTITSIPSLEQPASPVSETRTIPLGTPTRGEVETRGTSYYTVTGLTAGQPYTVSLLTPTSATDLHVYADQHIFEIDCTLRFNGVRECTYTPTGDLYFSVSSGPLNRDGAAYYMLVQ
jgi:hypothetical protein